MHASWAIFCINHARDNRGAISIARVIAANETESPNFVTFYVAGLGRRPFFLMVSHYAVHVPHQATPETIERCRRRWVAAGNPDHSPADPEFKKHFPKWQYAAIVDETDASLGAILDALTESSEFDNTYVVFTSDNGGGFSRRDEAGSRFNGPLQEGKRSTLEGGLRVPFVVSGPGIECGAQCDVPVVQWDLLPTLHDLSGGQSPLPAGIDGGTLREVFEQGNAGRVRRSIPGLVFHYTCHYHPPISVIRIGDYKLMRHLNSGELKLFNVAADYVEQHDLSAQLKEKAMEMDQFRAQYIASVDGGAVSEVYAAYFEWLNEQHRRAEDRFDRDLEALTKQNPPDLELQRDRLEQQWQAAQRKHAAKTAICKDRMTNLSWRESTKNEVVKRIGRDKQGYPIETRQ